jgi:hypothetical protein
MSPTDTISSFGSTPAAVAAGPAASISTLEASAEDVTEIPSEPVLASRAIVTGTLVVVARAASKWRRARALLLLVRD